MRSSSASRRFSSCSMQQRLDAARHVVEGRRQPAKLVVRSHGDWTAEFAALDPLGSAEQLVHRSGDRSRQREAVSERHDLDDEQQHADADQHVSKELTEAERAAGSCGRPRKRYRAGTSTLIGIAVRVVSPVCQLVWVRYVAVLNTERRRRSPTLMPAGASAVASNSRSTGRSTNDGIRGGRSRGKPTARTIIRCSVSTSPAERRLLQPRRHILRRQRRQPRLPETASRWRSRAWSRSPPDRLALARLRTASSSRACSPDP